MNTKILWHTPGFRENGLDIFSTLSCDSERGVTDGSYFSPIIYVISVTLPIKILKFRYFSE